MVVSYKGFRLIKDNFNMWTINQMGSGATPDALQGDYSRVEYAQQAINGYEPKRGAKKHVETSNAADL